MIPRENYYRDDILPVELDRLFKSGFEFVCLTSEVANHKDFVCVDYPGCSVVVQNFRGELKAFQNVCTHRFNQIQTEDRGNRSLTCQYHGWTFNAGGCPIGVASQVVLNGESDADLCLPEYGLETCGQFVFIKRGTHDLTLRQYLGAYHDLLQEISRHMGPVIEFGGVEHQANWKVLVENVIDILHCPVLHQDSLVAMGFCTKPIPETEIDGPHTSAHNLRTPGPREKVRQRALAHLDAREYKHDSFYHIHIFPNLFIASTEGMSFYIGHALPRTAEQTLLRTRYLEPSLTLKPSHRTMQDLLNVQSGESGLRIVEEDRAVLERIQRGLRISERPGVMLKGEPRLAHFAKMYAAMMA